MGAVSEPFKKVQTPPVGLEFGETLEDVGSGQHKLCNPSDPNQRQTKIHICFAHKRLIHQFVAPRTVNHLGFFHQRPGGQTSRAVSWNPWKAYMIHGTVKSPACLQA